MENQIMHKMKKNKKSTRREKDSVKKKTILNPYDLKNDLLKVLRYFPNANATAEVIGRTVEYKDIVLLKISDANGDKKVGRADVNELKKDRGEDIGSDVETTTISKDIDTAMQNENTNKGIGIDKENKVENGNKSKEINTEMDAEGKKIIFIVHGLSTFELWKIPCLYETTQLKLLISFYLSHLKNFDIFLIPVANPDGFARRDNDWNKNVSPHEGCGGVALDRNFDIAWASKSNVSSCDQLYPGPEPFSEAETEAIKDVFLRYGKRMAAYIHVHATDNNFDYRGNTVLIPKGHTDEESDEDKYLDLKGEIDEAMRKVFNTASVNLKTVYIWYGPVAGTSVDYAAEIIGVPFAMEFLMQPYQGTAKIPLNQASLTHIWKRVIDTVFTFIHTVNNSKESD
ncbi:carboxypeptidase B-like isoform X1 [Aricia agestis]|uniref:carboxypeptidase B-like isoform X1 n=1 Tax=Aricia agestis TaxID=91739 RepID=UPI001C2085E5|nr:carboxypeptidase B-like isoform X1 [Aricia agestis]XP_041984631.1 carboxypeptidase B-like isoform X1 [Aricia agestis]XP_041984632.1 carboxypeptidase B-like isoform X1 [Aricia agestis]